MKFIVFSEQHLKTYIRQLLLPHYALSFFDAMLSANNLTYVEFISGVFNLDYLPHYHRLTPSSTSDYEYRGIVLDFANVLERCVDCDVKAIYGIDPLDAIYYHAGFSTGYDGFAGHFYDDLHSLVGTLLTTSESRVHEESFSECASDMACIVRCVVEMIEAQFIGPMENMQSWYISVHAYKGSLRVFAKQ